MHEETESLVPVVLFGRPEGDRLPFLAAYCLYTEWRQLFGSIFFHLDISRCVEWLAVF